jgi:hypothetical protein
MPLPPARFNEDHSGVLSLMAHQASDLKHPLIFLANGLQKPYSPADSATNPKWNLRRPRTKESRKFGLSTQIHQRPRAEIGMVIKRGKQDEQLDGEEIGHQLVA